MTPNFLRRLTYLAFLGSLAGLILWWWQPVNGLSTRLLFLASLLGMWGSGAILLGKWPRARLALLALPPVLAALLLILPARPVDAGELRESYTRNLRQFAGCPYFWGGEERRGIDCSGLPRESLRAALLSYGLRHAEPGSIRAAARLWWHDASAHALMTGYRDYARPLGVSGQISTLDTTNLLPGDLAITSAGVHVLVYLGQGQWIQADPVQAKVAVEDGATGRSDWFKMGVSMFRWSEFH